MGPYGWPILACPCEASASTYTVPTAYQVLAVLLYSCLLFSCLHRLCWLPPDKWLRPPLGLALTCICILRRSLLFAAAVCVARLSLPPSRPRHLALALVLTLALLPHSPTAQRADCKNSTHAHTENDRQSSLPQQLTSPPLLASVLTSTPLSTPPDPTRRSKTEHLGTRCF